MCRDIEIAAGERERVEGKRGCLYAGAAVGETRQSRLARPARAWRRGGWDWRWELTQPRGKGVCSHLTGYRWVRVCSSVPAGRVEIGEAKLRRVGPTRSAGLRPQCSETAKVALHSCIAHLHCRERHSIALALKHVRFARSAGWAGVGCETIARWRSTSLELETGRRRWRGTSKAGQSRQVVAELIELINQLASEERCDHLHSGSCSLLLACWLRTSVLMSLSCAGTKHSRHERQKYPSTSRESSIPMWCSTTDCQRRIDGERQPRWRAGGA